MATEVTAQVSHRGETHMQLQRTSLLGLPGSRRTLLRRRILG